MIGLQKYFTFPTFAHSGCSETVLFTAFSLFIAVQLLFSQAVVTTIVFYGVLAPALLLYSCQNHRQLWKMVAQHKMLLILFFYTLVHALFLTDKTQPVFRTVGAAMSTAVFVMAAILFFQMPSHRVERFFRYIAGIACVTAWLSIIIFYTSYIDRLLPWGRARHEILGASVYATIGLICLYLYHQSHSCRTKLFYAFTLGTIVLLVLLTKSRGPIIALGFCVGLGIFFYTRYYARLVLAIAAIGVVIAGLYWGFPDIWNRFYAYLLGLIERGDSYRFALWKLTVEEIVKRPLLGHGMQSRLDFPVAYVYAPHNIFLSSVYYTGMVGGLLFMGVLVQSGGLALKGRHHPHGKLALLLLFHALISGMTDHGPFVKGPAPLWIIFWLPLCLIYANVRASPPLPKGER